MNSKNRRLIPRQPKRRTAVLASSIAALVALWRPATAPAATQTWQGNGADGNWSTSGNFTPGAPFNGSQDLIFGGNNYLTTNFLDAGYGATSANSLTFAGGAGAFTLRGGALTIGSSTPLSGEIINNSANLQTIDLSQLGVFASTFWFAGLGGLNIISPVLLETQTGAVALDIDDRENVGNTTMSGSISEQAGASGSLIEIGTGTSTLTLTSSNTYTGGTTMEGGTLSFANGSLGSSGVVDFVQNSTLQWLGNNTQDISSRLRIESGVTATIDTNGNNVTFGSALQTTGMGASGFTKTGLGTLTLAAVNTRLGAVTINGGTLQLGTGATAGSIDFSSGISVAAGGTLAVVNTGGIFFNTIVNAGGTSQGGPFGVVNFSLNATAGMANITNNGGSDAYADGGNTNFSGNATAGQATIGNNGGTTANGFGGSTIFSDNATAGQATITNDGGTTASGFGGSTSFSGNATAGNAMLTTNGGTANGAGGGKTFFYGNATAGNATLSTNGATVNGGSGGQTFFYGNATAGNATLTANGATVNGGGGGQVYFSVSSSAGAATLNINGGTNGGGGGAVYFQGNADGGIATVNDNAGGTLDISGLSGAGMNIGSISGAGTIALGSKTLTLVGSTIDGDFSGVIEDGGIAGGTGGSLTISAIQPGLSGQNTYTGTTSIINGGTLYAEVAGALPAPAADGGTGTTRAALSMDQTGTGFSTLVLFANQAVASLTGKASSMIQLNGSTLTVGNTNAGVSTFAGVISDGSAPGGLTVDGSGALILTGINTYTGQTTVNSGGLEVGDGTSGNLPGTSGVMVNFSGMLITDLATGSVFGANVTLNSQFTQFVATQNGTNTISGSISGPGQFSQDGSGTTIFTGAKAYTGGTFVYGGTLQLGTATAAGSIAAGVAVTFRGSGTLSLVNVTGGTFTNDVAIDSSGVGTVNINSATTITLSGALTDGSGAGQLALTKNGPGTAIISGTSNTYSGATTVNGGTLEVDGSLVNTTVTVNKNAALSGTGSIGGNVNILSGGTLQPVAGSSSIGGNLVLNTGANTSIQLGAPSSVDDETVNGNLTIAGNLSLTPIAGFGVGTYALFGYNGTLTNHGFTITGLPGYTTQITVVGNVVDLTVTLAGALPTLIWDGPSTVGTGTIAGGSGTWNTSTTNWTNTGGTTNSNWKSGTAVFNTTGGTVTLGAAVSAQGLIFGVDGYTIDGSTALKLTLTGPAPIVSVTNSGDTATINAPITSSAGLLANGAGTLVLANTGNAISGKVSVVTGALQIGTAAAGGSIGPSAAVTLSNDATLTVLNVLNNTLPNAIGAGLGQIGTVNITSANNLTISGALTDSAPGQLALTLSGTGTTTLTNSKNTFSGATTIGANTLQIGTTTTPGSLGAGSPVNFNGNGTLSLVSVSGNVFANNITITSGGTASVTVNTAASIALIGQLADTTGTLSFTKVGTGTAILSGSNSYLGATTVNAGTLQIGDGKTAGTTIASSGQVQVNGSAILATNLASGAILANAVSLNTATSVVNAIQTGTNTLSGAISGSGGFNQKGTGTTILTADDTFTGPTTVTAGLLQIGDGTSGNLTKTSGITVSGTGDLALDLLTFKFTPNIKLSTAANRLEAIEYFGTTIAGIISGLGGFDQDGPAVTFLSSAETYTGGTNVNAGALIVEVGASLAPGIIHVNGGSLGVRGSVAAGSTIIVAPAGTLAGPGTINANVTSSGTLNLSRGIAGTLTLNGGSWIGTGTVTQAVTVSSGAFNLAGNLTALVGLTVTGGTLAGTGTLIGSLNDTSASGSIFGGVIADGTAPSALTVNKSTADLTLTGANTYTGATTLSAGFLQIGDGNTGSIAVPSAVKVTSGTLILDLPNNASFANPVSLSSSTAVFEASGAGVFVDLTGVISGTGSYKQSGSGSSILDANETYTGATNVNAGTLIINGSVAAGSTVNVTAPGTLQGTGTIHGNVTSQGTLDFDGSIGGTLGITGGTWTGNGTVAKAVTVSSGAFTLNGQLTAPIGLTVTGGTLAGTGTLTGNLNYTSTASSTFAGIIADGTAASKLTMNKAASTLTLTGVNTYTGATTVTAGTLRVNGSLANTPVVVNSGGILAGFGTINGGETINTGGILAPSSGSTPTTFTVGPLVLNSGAKVNYQLGGAGQTAGNDLTDVDGSLSLGTGGTLNITPLFGFGAGTYALFDATSAPTGTLKIGTISTGFVAADFSFHTVGDVVNLVVTGGPTVQYWNGAGGGGINGGTGTWDNSTADWANSAGTANTAWAQSVAVFSAGSGTATVGANVTVHALGFVPGSGAYTVSVSPTFTLTISGAGLTNTSGTTQNLATTTDGTGNFGLIDFTNSATAGSATTFTNQGSTVSSASFVGAGIYFKNTSNAGSAAFINQGSTIVGGFGGFTEFDNSASAGSATFTNDGGANTGVNGVAGGGGGTYFTGTSDGGTAQVTNIGNGFLDISGLTSTGMKIGSIAGSGAVLLGSKTLTVGGNNLSTVFSGVIADGGEFNGVKGSLVKTGTGTLTLTGANTYTGATTVSAGTLQIGDGTTVGTNLNTSGVTVTSKTTLAVDLPDGGDFPSNVTNNGHFVTTGASNNYTVSSLISGAGNLTQSGTNTVTLTGANTYSGGTTINAGALVASNTSGSATGTGAVAVNNGGTLGGSGKITGATTLNSGGTIAPGAGSPGVPGTTLHATSVMWNPGGAIDLQLGSAGHDELILSGALTKGTTGTGAYTIDIDDSGMPLGNYTLATFASTTFAATNFTLDLPGNYAGTLSITSGKNLVLDLTAGSGQQPADSQGTDLLANTDAPTPSTDSGTSSFSLTPTPEPESVMLLAFGGVAVLGWRRKRM